MVRSWTSCFLGQLGKSGWATQAEGGAVSVPRGHLTRFIHQASLGIEARTGLHQSGLALAVAVIENDRDAGTGLGQVVVTARAPLQGSFRLRDEDTDRHSSLSGRGRGFLSRRLGWAVRS